MLVRDVGWIHALCMHRSTYIIVTQVYEIKRRSTFLHQAARMRVLVLVVDIGAYKDDENKNKPQQQQQQQQQTTTTTKQNKKQNKQKTTTKNNKKKKKKKKKKKTKSTTQRQNKITAITLSATKFRLHLSSALIFNKLVDM